VCVKKRDEGGVKGEKVILLRGDPRLRPREKGRNIPFSAGNFTPGRGGGLILTRREKEIHLSKKKKGKKKGLRPFGVLSFKERSSLSRGKENRAFFSQGEASRWEKVLFLQGTRILEGNQAWGKATSAEKALHFVREGNKRKYYLKKGKGEWTTIFVTR